MVVDVSLYIDATGGGMILQLLLSGFVGGAVVFKLFWRNMVNTILRRSDPEDERDGQEDLLPDTLAEHGQPR